GVAVAAAATHVRREHDIAACDKVLHDGVERRAVLAFWPAMHIDDGWPRRRAGPARRVKECRNLALIERGKVDQAGGDEGIARDTADCAACDLRERPGCDIERPYVERRVG